VRRMSTVDRQPNSFLLVPGLEKFGDWSSFFTTTWLTWIPGAKKLFLAHAWLLITLDYWVTIQLQLTYTTLNCYKF
jgi:hypothetical protein